MEHSKRTLEENKEQLIVCEHKVTKKGNYRRGKDLFVTQVCVDCGKRLKLIGVYL